MSSNTGFSPKSPNRYLGPNVYLSSVVNRNRRPTGADYRQPETGKLYPNASFWLVGEDPTTGVQGELWYLSMIVANVSYWVLLSDNAGPLLWNDITDTSATMESRNGYQANNAGLVTLTMPSIASSTFGDTIKVAGFGAGGWLIQCVSSQIIHLGSSATTAGGSIASTNRYDGIELVCSSTTSEWFCNPSAIGTLTVA